jgi:hypothetical protein
MRALKPAISIVAVIFWCGSTGTALADQSIVYSIHETPADPNSPVVLKVTLTVTEDQQDGSSIGWRVVQARFESMDVPVSTWTAADPPVDTIDGLWWIVHADPNNPATEEIVMPPAVSGTAAAEDPTDPDLEYAFDGLFYDVEQRGALYEVTGSLNFSFVLAGETAAFEEGGDEPVEVEPHA